MSEAQRNNPDPNGPQEKNYLYATPGGSSVFFSSGEKLTNNSRPSPGSPDLYRYDVAAGNLTDLTTPIRTAPASRGLGVSDNGIRVYFAANGALAPGATDGQPNLYVRDGGTTTFITALDPTFSATRQLGDRGSSKTGRVTADGRTLLFSSRASAARLRQRRVPWSSTATTWRATSRLHLLRPERRSGDRRRGLTAADRRISLAGAARSPSAATCPPTARRSSSAASAWRPEDTNGK